jgi:hypothetical protein
MPTNVPDVPNTELMLQTVNVLQVSLTKTKTQSVLDVLTDVKLVLLVTFVSNVTLQELMLQVVVAQVVNSIPVDPPTPNLVTQIALTHNAETVTIPVRLVPDLHKDLVSVLLTESKTNSISVSAEKDLIMLKETLTVHLVMPLVPLVPEVPLVVPLVPNKEPSEMMITVSPDVNVTMDTMKILKDNVFSVTTNVFLVKPTKTTVSNVTETESDLTIVDVQRKLMITVLQSVQTVVKNVLFVKTCQTTVSTVPQVESTHQNVISQNQVQNLPKLKTSQWPPLELFNAHADVLLVNMPELTVLPVLITESMLQFVPVPTDTSKTITVPVKNVLTNVLLVLTKYV